jgi:hypothetical protein
MSLKDSIPLSNLEQKWIEEQNRRHKIEKILYNKAIVRIRQGTLGLISKQDMCVTSSVNLCAQCRSMFKNCSEWGRSASVPHYELIYQVITAARQGCGLCYLLMGIINADRKHLELAQLKLEGMLDRWEQGPHFQLLVSASRGGVDNTDGYILRFDPKQICTIEEKPLYKNMKSIEIHLCPSAERPKPMGHLPSTLEGNQENFYQQVLSLPEYHGTKSSVWEANISTVRLWLKECLNTHECSSTPSSLPARLLKVKDDPIHIQDTPHLPRNTKYCTLSHCWGPNPDLTWQLKKEKLEMYHTSIPVQAFSKTFQDAIYITRSLGIDYLWIDSLCIIQEDEEDFQREATRMSTTYGNSFLNIAATSASSGKEGCLIYKPFLPFLKTIIELEDKCYQAYPAYIADYGFWETPLSSRAWCYQERILAPRTLHFSHTQLYWDCNSKFTVECFPSRLPASVRNGGDSWIEKKNLAYHWPEMVFEYTTSNLTDPHDKLVAFAGVVKRMEEQLQDKCYAGIWQNHIERNLLWCSYHPRPVQGYRAPSWSWAANDGDIGVPSLEDPDEELFARVLDINVTPHGSDPHGQLSAGAVKMACQSIVDITTGVHEAVVDGSCTKGLSVTAWKATIVVFWDTTSLLDMDVSAFYAVLVTKGSSVWAIGPSLRGLIIVPRLGEKGVFQRIGTFALLEGEEDQIIASTQSREPETIILV